EEIRGRIEMLGERQILVHGLDSERAGFPRIRDRDRFALEQHFSAVSLVDAGDDLDQRCLAGSVVTDDRMDLVWTEREVAFTKRHHAAEALLDIACLEKRGALLHVSTTSLSSGAGIHRLNSSCQD